MPKIRIVFEFEQEEARITPALLKEYWPEVKAGEEAEAQHRKNGIESELAMLAAVKAQPQIVRQLWLERALSWVRWLENSTAMDLLKGAPGRVDLEPLANELDEYARRYFVEDGMLDGTQSEMLARDVIDLRLCRIQVEDEEGILLSSDELPKRGNKKNPGKGKK